jgi:hypothetical protein
MKDVRAAWKHAHTAWGHVEASLTELAEAEGALLRSLRAAGTVWTRKARTEVNVALKQIDRKRKSTGRQFAKLSKRYEALLSKKPATTAKRAPAARSAAARRRRTAAS